MLAYTGRRAMSTKTYLSDKIATVFIIIAALAVAYSLADDPMRIVHAFIQPETY